MSSNSSLDFTPEMKDELYFVLNHNREHYCDGLAKASDKSQPAFLERIRIIDALLDWAMSFPVQGETCDK